MHNRLWFLFARAQIKLDLSNHDKYKRRKVVGVIPMDTICCMLGELQSRLALTVLIEEVSKLYEAKLELLQHEHSVDSKIYSCIQLSFGGFKRQHKPNPRTYHVSD